MRSALQPLASEPRRARGGDHNHDGRNECESCRELASTARAGYSDASSAHGNTAAG